MKNAFLVLGLSVAGFFGTSSLFAASVEDYKCVASYKTKNEVVNNLPGVTKSLSLSTNASPPVFQGKVGGLSFSASFPDSDGELEGTIEFSIQNVGGSYVSVQTSSFLPTGKPPMRNTTVNVASADGKGSIVCTLK